MWKEVRAHRVRLSLPSGIKQSIPGASCILPNLNHVLNINLVFISMLGGNLLKVCKKPKKNQMQIPSSGWSGRNKTGRHAANAQLGELRTVILSFIRQRTVLVSPAVHMYLSLLLIAAMLLCMMGKPEWHHQPKEPSSEFSVQPMCFHLPFGR